jgi:hypothetical protein
MYIIKLYRRLTLSHKFIFLGCLCLAVISLPTLLYIKEVRKLIVFSEREQQGLVPAQLMLNIIQRAQQHRGLAAQYLADPATVKKERRKKAEDLELAIIHFEDYARKNNTGNIIAAVNAQTLYWHKISTHLTQRDISVAQSFKFHSALIRMQLNTLQMVVDHYQLSFDPEANGYFLIYSGLMGLPELTEIMDKMRAMGIQLLMKREADFFERVELKSLLLLSEVKLAEVNYGIAKTLTTNPSRAADIRNAYQLSKETQIKNIDLLQNEILSKEIFIVAPTDYSAEFNAGIEAYFSYANFAIKQIDSVLKERIAKNKQTMIEALAYILVITLLVIFICAHYVRKLLRQLGGAPDSATAILRELQSQPAQHEGDHSIDQ